MYIFKKEYNLIYVHTNICFIYLHDRKIHQEPGKVSSKYPHSLLMAVWNGASPVERIYFTTDP